MEQNEQSTEKVFKMKRKRLMAARMLADGYSLTKIASVLWNVTKPDGNTDKGKLDSALVQLRKWRRMPEFTELYRETLREMTEPACGKAMKRITEQVDDENPWIAQNAAREVLTRFLPIVMGEDDKTITIKVEGMPELGTPEE